jgi:hypothetical protein
VTIVRHAAAPLLVALACTACGIVQDPPTAPSVGSVNSAPAATEPSSTPTHAGTRSTKPRTTQPAQAKPPRSTPRHADIPSAKPSTTQPAEATLPRGGHEVFPRYRLVGYAGVTGAPTLGRLGMPARSAGRRDRAQSETLRRRARNLAGRRGDRDRRPGQSWP